MDFKLMVRCGKINYLVKQNGEPVGSSTPKDSAEWMLEQYKPVRSTEFPNYPISVTVADGTQYFYEGIWPEPQKKPTRRKKVDKK